MHADRRPDPLAQPPGARSWRAWPTIATALLAMAAALVSPQNAAGQHHLPPVVAAPAAAEFVAPLPAPRRADFGAHVASDDARQIADWVADSGDHGGTEFIVIDKQFARIYVFDGEARLRGASPVLLGSAIGDDTVPGIGTRPIAEVLPHERTTPAGRFVAERGINTHGEDIVWVDYDAAVSIHRVRATNPAERRLERLASPSVDDNRISYGCINVSVEFYERNLRPLFAAQTAIVYVLPETRPAMQVFNAYPVDTPRSADAAAAQRIGQQR